MLITLGAYVWLFAGTLLLEALVIPLGGALIHHGRLSVLGVVLATVLGSVARSLVRHRLRRRKSGQRLNWFQRVVAPRPSSLLRSLLWVGALLAFGYLAGHVVHSFPDTLRIGYGALGLVLLVLLIARTFDLLPGALGRKVPRTPPGGLLHSATVGAIGALIFLIPWWPPQPVTVEELLSESFKRQHLVPNLASLHWIDAPRAGLRNALVAERAVLLAEEPGAPPDVYLVHFAFSHDGKPARITNTYNLSDTAAVAEGDLTVWRKWAAWSIRLEQRPLSVEVADFRGEAPGRGEGWGATERVQRAITNVQEVGQLRGVARSSVRLVEPANSLQLRITEGVLHIDIDQQAIELAVGRDAQEENTRGLVDVAVVQTPLPGDLVTWSVDRLRAMPWIGSDGMQWLKALAFRAADEIETIENDLVGIDADEQISEELGDVLSTLPLARAGDIPHWPPAPIEPLLSPPLAAEGRWVDMARDVLVGADEDRGGSPFVFSFIRTDPARTYNQVSVTLWDPRRIQLHIAAGTVEPRSMTGELGSGLISREPAVLERLVGAFNGAFQAVHGEFGMMEDRRVILMPKPYAATVATSDDGSVGFGSWPDDNKIAPNLIGLRQNMSPLVVDDVVNPYKRHWWGGVPEGWTEETRTVRSGLCLTREGFLAYFYSPSIDPERLGEAMRRVRCSYGMHLDMNAGHTGFEFYRVAKQGSLPGLGRPLDALWEASGTVSGVAGYDFLSRLMVRKMPLMNFPRYIHRSSRDFFYLTRRALLPGPPLPGPPDAPQATIPWGIVDTPHNEWPHALVMAELSVLGTEGSTTLFRLTRIDEKQVTVQSESQQGEKILDLLLPAKAAAPTGEIDVAMPTATAELVLVSSARGLALVASSNTTRKPAMGQITMAEGFRDASAETRGALCLSAGQLLTLIETQGQPTPEAWRSVITRSGCGPTLFLKTPAHVMLPSSDKAQRREGNTVSLLRRPFVGARRIFESTPILPPQEWAIPQARRVPYVPNAAPAE